MALTIDTASQNDLSSPAMSDDPMLFCMNKGIDAQLQAINALAPSLIMLPALQNVTSAILDLIAWQFHVDFYDPMLPFADRLAMVQRSVQWHQIKGTPAAVQQMLSQVFAYSEIIEWFDYAGKPYHFQVITTDQITNPTQVANMYAAINASKNVRSWLDGVGRIATGTMTFYSGMAIGVARHTILNATRPS